MSDVDTPASGEPTAARGLLSLPFVILLIVLVGTTFRDGIWLMVQWWAGARIPARLPDSLRQPLSDLGEGSRAQGHADRALVVGRAPGPDRRCLLPARRAQRHLHGHPVRLPDHAVGPGVVRDRLARRAGDLGGAVLPRVHGPAAGVFPVQPVEHLPALVLRVRLGVPAGGGRQPSTSKATSSISAPTSCRSWRPAAGCAISSR